MRFSADTLNDNRIVLLLADSRKLKQTNTAVISELTRNGYNVLIVSVTLPNIVVRRTYEAAEIDLAKIYVVDAVTRYSDGPTVPNDPHCKYISNPGNLTDIGIAITEWIKPLPGEKKCLFVDDISTMLLYSPSITISKFIHFITNKLRLFDVAGVFLAVEKGLDPALFSQISTFTDLIQTIEDDEKQKALKENLSAD
ncbi:MAG: hypothetical protein NTV68_04020 [Methanomicrobiales archaeon]|nr:hypothetical protein [Methanomicrobiales archaeon]